MIPKKLLIFPAGTEIAFEILNALKYSKFVEIYGGTSADDHSELVYKNLIKGFPFIDDDDFLEYLNNIIREKKIDCIYPAHDSVSVFLSNNANKINAQVIITDSFTTNICRDKTKTYEYLKGENYIPKYYKNLNEVKVFPVFVKPSIGQGSNGAKIINNYNELKEAAYQNPNLVICEYLSGEEYTVDCFTDQNKTLLTVKPRTRERIKTGISVKSRTIQSDTKINEIANSLNSKFNFKGAWFFQLKKNQNNEYRLLEVSPRIPGTMGVSRNLGINFPMLTLFVYWNFDVSIIDNKYNIMLDRAFYSAYQTDINYQHIYLDFDDTLIINNEVNQDLMRFIYQALNKNKAIHLLSKHLTDIYKDLDKYRIARNIFDEIIIIKPYDEKYKYINPNQAIFIDDSFAERKKIKEKLNIPVFDLDMIESLIDWRR